MRTSKASAAFLSALLVMVLLTSGARAQTGDGYDLTWHTVDGGGGTVGGASSSYTLMGTAGQPDAGAALTGGGYSLYGGFWPGSAAVTYGVYLPLVLRNYQ